LASWAADTNKGSVDAGRASTKSRRASRAWFRSELEDGRDVVLESFGLLFGVGLLELGSWGAFGETWGSSAMSERLVPFWCWWRRSSFSRKFGLGLWDGLWDGNGCCLNRAVSRLVRGRRVREGRGGFEFIGVLLGRLCGF
jgi:hypothetical protein